MAENISWNFVAKALKGPSVSGADSLDVDAYDKFNLILEENTPPQAVTQVVNLVPAGTISLLIINPKKPNPDLSYEIGGNAVALDGPHVLIGTGAVSLLGGATSLTFTNETGAEAVVEILIGRDATP